MRYSYGIIKELHNDEGIAKLSERVKAVLENGGTLCGFSVNAGYVYQAFYYAFLE